MLFLKAFLFFKVKKENNMKFTSLPLNEKLQQSLAKHEFTDATVVQEKTIEKVLEGHDIVVRSQTGSGKTFAFALPILQKVDFSDPTVQSLVVCPTRELALQVANEFKKLAENSKDLRIVSVYGGSDMQRQIVSLKQKPQIIVGTPGRIMDHMRRRTIKLHNLKTVVLDEADEMLNMGFKEDMETILQSTPATRQTLMFSATYPAAIKAITKQFMQNPISIEVGQENKSLSSIKQTYAQVNAKSKKEALLEFFEKFKPQHPIVFTNTKAMADDLAELLVDNNYNALALHGELRQSQRKRVMDAIKKDTTSILVASDVAARGIDLNDIDYIINYDLPYNVEYFLHRMGRTARAGKSGNAFTLISSRDQLVRLREFEKETNAKVNEITLTQSIGDNSNKKERISSKPATGREGRSYGRKPSGDRNYAKKSGEGRSYSRKPKDETKGFSSKPSYDKEKFADRKPKSDYGKTEGKPSFDKKPSEGRSYARKTDGAKRSYSDKPKFGDEKPYSRKPRAEYGNADGKPVYGKKPFASKEGYAKKTDGYDKPFGKKVSNYGERSSEPRAFGKQRKEGFQPNELFTSFSDSPRSKKAPNSFTNFSKEKGSTRFNEKASSRPMGKSSGKPYAKQKRGF